MGVPSDPEQRRKHARVSINVPLNFKIIGEPGQNPGLVINASETGLLIQTFKDMPTGKRITIEVLCSEGPRSSKVNAMSEIIWKDIYVWEGWDAYQYGLRFVQISDEDHLKLKHLLSSQSGLEEVTFRDGPDHQERLVIKVKS